jgi:rfaE bifunctional protein nucleotidyltransferase chain/domain
LTKPRKHGDAKVEIPGLQNFPFALPLFRASAMSSPTDASKLRTLESAVARRATLRAEGRKVVLTNGVFDLLHPGHLHYLRHAAALGDALFIALNSDASVRQLKGPGRPVESEGIRAAKLCALSYVDTVVIFREPRLTAEIRGLRPDIYCKAGDYTLDKLDPGERFELEQAGTRIEFMPFLPGHSTTALIAQRSAAVARGTGQP